MLTSWLGLTAFLLSCRGWWVKEQYELFADSAAFLEVLNKIKNVNVEVLLCFYFRGDLVRLVLEVSQGPKIYPNYLSL